MCELAPCPPSLLIVRLVLRMHDAIITCSANGNNGVVWSSEIPVLSYWIDS